MAQLKEKMAQIILSMLTAATLNTFNSCSLFPQDQHEVSIDEYAVSKLLNIKGIRLTNPTCTRIPGIISILVEKSNVNNERFIKEIADEFALSTGSACSAGEPSHVLDAMGLGNMTSNVLRISLNKYTTKAEVDHMIAVLSKTL